MVMMARPLPQIGRPLPRPPVAVDPILPGKPGVLPGGPGRPAPGGGGVQDRLDFYRRDTNRDGALSQREFGIKPLSPIGGLHDLKAQHEALERFKKFDANGDGQISKEEYVIGRHWERLTEKADSWFDKLRPAPQPGSPFGPNVRPTGDRPAVDPILPGQRRFGEG